MDQSIEALKVAHGNFRGAADDFARAVLSLATGKTVTYLENVAFTFAPEERVIVRSGGSCGVYDNGVCRLCTPAEDQGEILQ